MSANDPQNRATRRRAEREKRRGKTRNKFKRTTAAQTVEAIKSNVARWETEREFHELNIDKNEALIDAADSSSDGYAERVAELEAGIKTEEDSIESITVAIANGEARIAELLAI